MFALQFLDYLNRWGGRNLSGKLYTAKDRTSVKIDTLNNWPRRYSDFLLLLILLNLLLLLLLLLLTSKDVSVLN
jgi:hypothetical protein